MKDLNADFFEMLNGCAELSDVELAWQDWMTRLGYARSAIFAFSWQSGRLEVLRQSTNWDADILADYLNERYYRFDSIGNPLRKSSSFTANHIETFSFTGKSKQAANFVDWVRTLNFPGQVSVSIIVAPGLRLSFTGFVQENERLFRKRAQETQDNITLAANAAAARYMHLTNGVIYSTKNPLSPREVECLVRLANGDRMTDIAEHLGVNTKTVEFHLAGARHKLDAKTSAQAVVISLRNHYIHP